MDEIRLVFISVGEDFKGKVEVLLVVDHRDEGFGEEPLGPWFYWGVMV